MADLVERPVADGQISPTAVRWTRQDCANLERAGFLTYRYELVEGVINRMGQNLAHANTIRLLIRWLVAAIGIDFFFTQATIDVRPEDNPTNAPEPDGVVLNRPAGDLTTIPVPADIRLLIEAADSTLNYDLTIKAGLYARARIPEYWVVSIQDRKMYVHRLPMDGVYTEVTAYGGNEQVAALGAPPMTLNVSELFPPQNQA